MTKNVYIFLKLVKRKKILCTDTAKHILQNVLPLFRELTNIYYLESVGSVGSVTQTMLFVIKSDSVFKMKYSFRVSLKVISFCKEKDYL